mmetsp:Transcript_84027/g.122869  ORF Transcript_84027/g.122869 Transcript_84027/m.122869 type:complete len:215 (+) Transcript_84027:11-655(+)|eukprot:CAMPEP_0173101132 /NCGR_PEP_ID=MMETSP1102-20130122/36638_1 /TAXON_ID=49646 /ORGANISM="Geminigera sp., Strain Caron Lab Isolate" /LENGTH=214 /DNA_ID=CAMNT_0013994749 /DNA_START=11 /DNA_END=655 /DNA_ORIENTATION=+
MRTYVGVLFIAMLQAATAFHTGSSALPLRCAGRSAVCSRQSVHMTAAEGVVGRRALLSEVLAAGVVVAAAAPVSAKVKKAKSGAWAAHEGDFTEDELDGFTETKTGLLYKDVEEGTGVIPQPGQKIKAHYSGYLLETGKKFDSSYERGKPLPFAVGTGQVIKGWDEGLLTMKVGGKRMMVIPAKLAYGSKAVGGGLIPANSDLVFYVELVTIAA